MSKTRIMPCSCAHVDQDERYGRQMRLHNETLKKPSSGGWCCTVCGKVKPK